MAYLAHGNRYASQSHFKVKSKLAASTRKAFLAAITSLYQYLITVELVEANPTAAVPRPRVKHKRGKCLTPDELRRLLSVTGTPRDRVQVYLLAFTGARVSEIRNLRWRDISLDQATMLGTAPGSHSELERVAPSRTMSSSHWLTVLSFAAPTGSASTPSSGQ